MTYKEESNSKLSFIDVRVTGIGNNFETLVAL